MNTGKVDAARAGRADPARPGTARARAGTESLERVRRRGPRATALRVRARMRRHVVLNTAWRITVFVVGVTVVVAGLVMLVTPGPGWLGIIAGFAILATEFVWARHVLRQARRTAVAARERALAPHVRRRNQVLAVVAGVLAVAACVAYLVEVGLVLPWNVDWVRHLP